MIPPRGTLSCIGRLREPSFQPQFERLSDPQIPLTRLSFRRLFEIEIGQIHIALRQDVYSENIFPFTEPNLEKLGGEIPMVPLTPSHEVRGIVCGGDPQRSCCVHSVQID